MKLETVYNLMCGFCETPVETNGAGMPYCPNRECPRFYIEETEFTATKAEVDPL